MSTTGCGFLFLAALALLAGLIPFLAWTNLVVTLPLAVIGTIVIGTHVRKPAAQRADKAALSLALVLLVLVLFPAGNDVDMERDYLIRDVTTDDVPAFWELRLRALHDHPSAFGSDYEHSRLAGPTYAERGYFDGGVNRLFAAFAPTGQLVAQVGTYAETGKRSHIAHVISVYTHPDHRGRGLASRLVQAAIDHLQVLPGITSVRISVNASNLAAIHTYEKLGFVTWGEEPDAIRTADGSCHNELHMVLARGTQGS